MKEVDKLRREVAALRDRLSRINEANLRINETLDFDNVLQEVLDSARSLTECKRGGIVFFDDSDEIETFVTSGFTPQEEDQFYTLPQGRSLFETFRSIPEPVRCRDFYGYVSSLGFPQVRLPVANGQTFAFLAAPVLRGGQCVGNIYLAEREDGQDFTLEDEDILTTFASQAAVVISNARRYRDEQRARRYLETLINTAPVGVVVFDARTGNLESINREARRIAGDPAELDGTVEELFREFTFRRADGMRTSVADLSRSLEAVHAEEIVCETPDGRSIVLVVNATPILSEEGEVESLVVIVQDMTPLEELERLRAEFLGIVGHELRTPLTSIKGAATTLLEAASSLDPAETVQFHRIINEQADHMRDLISDLIDVVRIETGTLSVNPEPAEVPRLVDEARNTFLTAGGRSNIRINLSPDLPLVMADRRRIVQVITNLLSNAARNSHEESTIRVSAARENIYVTISVADDGRGVPAERLPHLFRKFSHLEGQERGRDLGLGLAICKGIVEAHGGRIWAESDGLGLGSRFTFTIPVAEDTVAVAAAPVPSRKYKGRTRVLAVDDDPRTLKQIRDALTQAGYEPVVTGNPDEVASLMEANDPHVVLLDLMLPGTDGIELMRDVLADHDVPVIFLSAYSQDEVVAKAFEMGAVDYMVKPFSPTELAARVKAALRKQAEPMQPYALGELTINYAERTVIVAGEPVELTATEYRMVVELSVNAGILLTHDQLLQKVWGLGRSGDARPMRTIVKNLRRKLGDEARSPKYIFTVPRVGYRMPKPESGNPTAGSVSD